MKDFVIHDQWSGDGQINSNNHTNKNGLQCRGFHVVLEIIENESFTNNEVYNAMVKSGECQPVEFKHVQVQVRSILKN